MDTCFYAANTALMIASAVTEQRCDHYSTNPPNCDRFSAVRKDFLLMLALQNRVFPPEGGKGSPQKISSTKLISSQFIAKRPDADASGLLPDNDQMYEPAPAGSKEIKNVHQQPVFLTLKYDIPGFGIYADTFLGNFNYNWVFSKQKNGVQKR